MEQKCLYINVGECIYKRVNDGFKKHNTQGKYRSILQIQRFFQEKSWLMLRQFEIMME